MKRAAILLTSIFGTFCSSKTHIRVFSDEIPKAGITNFQSVKLEIGKFEDNRKNLPQNKALFSMDPTDGNICRNAETRYDSEGIPKEFQISMKQFFKGRALFSDDKEQNSGFRLLGRIDVFLFQQARSPHSSPNVIPVSPYVVPNKSINTKGEGNVVFTSLRLVDLANGKIIPIRDVQFKVNRLFPSDNDCSSAYWNADKILKESFFELEANILIALNAEGKY